MVISQGDVFWAELGVPLGSEPGLRRPVVVVQNEAFNRSRIETVVVCPVTSSLGRGSCPGNVALARGEANLPKRSVVNVSQITTIDRRRLVTKLGALSKKRIREVLGGIYILLEPVSID